MRSSTFHSISITLTLCTLLISSCGDDEGVGTYEIRIFGEEFIEDEIPAEETDGWTITFSKFLVVVSDISASGPQTFSVSGARVFDLTVSSGGQGHLIETFTSATGAIASFQYRVAPATTATAGNTQASDVSTMTDNGYSVYAEGTATNGTETKTFTWGFTTDTTYSNCDTTASIPEGGAASSVITIHADHLFYDDLQHDEPNVVFALIASSDTDTDDVITQAELLAQDITSQARYQGGGSDVEDLWAFISALTHTLGHIDGEGHCHTD